MNAQRAEGAAPRSPLPKATTTNPAHNRFQIRNNFVNKFTFIPIQKLLLLAPPQQDKEILMGQLINGDWSNEWYDTSKSGGKFMRSTSGFRNWITPDGSAGPSGSSGFKAESGRYHLYVSYACPWAHRTLIFRQLKDLAPHITFDVVHPDMLDDG